MADSAASPPIATRSGAAPPESPVRATSSIAARSATPSRGLSARGGRWPIPVLVLLCIPVFYWNLGNYGLVNGDEGFYHRIAQNMVLSGDWLTVQWNGELRVYETFMNSPLQHWARAALISVFGYNYWTMRIISATCGALAVIFTYKLAREFMTAAEAFAAAIFLMFSYQFVFLHGARTGELDALLTFIFVWLAYSFVRTLRYKKSWIPHHLVLLALINIKLPVIIMPVMFEAMFFLLTPRYWRRIPGWIGIAVCLSPIFVAWHIYQFIDLGPRPVLKVLNLMADQAAGDKLQGSRQGRGGLWNAISDNAAYYGKNLLFGGFPYILFAPVALVGIWHRRMSRRSFDSLKIVLLALLAICIFFGIVSRRFPWYIIPTYPFIAILTARYLCRMERLGRGVILTGLFSVAAALTFLVKFRNNEVNPFAGRAMNFSPKPFFRDFLSLETWGAILVLAVAAFVVIYLVRFLTRGLKVHPIPLVTFFAAAIVGGMRIGEGLGYTEYFSHMELFAQRLTRSIEQGRDLQFPMDVPLSGAQNLAKYHFGDEFVVSAEGKAGVRLVRRLRPDERPSMKREDLKAFMSLSPLGVKTKSLKKPGNTGDSDESIPYTFRDPSSPWLNRSSRLLCLNPAFSEFQTGPLLW